MTRVLALSEEITNVKKEALMSTFKVVLKHNEESNWKNKKNVN